MAHCRERIFLKHMQKTSVLHVMNYAASYRGNFIDSLEALDKKIAEDGMGNVYMFCAAARENGSMQWISEMQQRGLRVFFLTEDRKADTKLIKKVMKDENVVAIHTHFISMQQFLPVYFAVGRNPIPVFMHMHNHSTEAKNPIKRILRRYIYRRCRMISCSESVYRSIERDYPNNIKYSVDNGVNFERLDDFSQLTHKEFSIPDEDTVFLIFGFDFYRKGVDLAVRAVEQLRKEGKKYSLLISLSTNFEMVEKNIRDIIGELPDWVHIIKARNDVASLYNFAELFLSPSREEGLPYSVVEASYCRCSVVMSDISAQVNLKIPYGRWCVAESVEDLAKAIEASVAEHGLKLENMDSVRNQMKENYSLDNWAEKIRTIYREVMK